MLNNLPLIAQHVLVLVLAWAGLRTWFTFDRLILRVGVMVLFCTQQYGWSLLAFVVLCIAESAHRRTMAEKRATGLYAGAWIE